MGRPTLPATKEETADWYAEQARQAQQWAETQVGKICMEALNEACGKESACNASSSNDTV